jgi:hypothetical protein
LGGATVVVVVVVVAGAVVVVEGDAVVVAGAPPPLVARYAPAIAITNITTTIPIIAEVEIPLSRTKRIHLLKVFCVLLGYNIIKYKLFR